MTIALIAGTGGLPPAVARALVAQGRTPIICEMRGFASDVTGDFARLPFRIETLGTLLADLTSRGVTEVCMAGAVQRPQVDPNEIDAATAPILPRLMAAMAKGDDGTLREIIAIFEDHGLAVVGAHDLAPDLLPTAGLKTKRSAPDMTANLAAAQIALHEMGQADLGQAMLLKNGAIVAREDANGTAAMLQNGPATANGAVFYKAPKPNQILKADMPTIGPDTAHQAAAAGLAGIIVAHGGVIVLDLAQTVEILDSHDMFLWVHP